jgi:hypothetical protein
MSVPPQDLFHGTEAWCERTRLTAEADGLGSAPN